MATIGYQGTTVAELVHTLLTAGIRQLIDVRAVPLSRKPGFSKRQLAAELDVVGVGYVNLRGLGTPRAGRDAARRGDVATMRAIFDRQLATDEAAADLALARSMVADMPCCLLCFERDPETCHRLAVAEVLGGPVRHLFCDIPELATPKSQGIGRAARRSRVARRNGGLIAMDLKDHIRAVPDFPKPGILFYDISTLLRDADAWQVAMGRLARAVSVFQPDLLAGVESRGFLLAAPLAVKLGVGFVMLRKRGKLPGATVGLDYALEYGSDRIEIQADAVAPGARVVVVDDLLATGGTMAAGIKLLRSVGAEVPAAAALIELTFLGGRARIDVPFCSLVAYDS